MITDKKIEAKDIKRLLLRVYRRYTSGAITEAQAHKEACLLNYVLKAIEVTDKEERQGIDFEGTMNLKTNINIIEDNGCKAIDD